MKTLTRLSLFVALVFTVSSLATGQTIFRSLASGNWGTAATWEKSTDGGSTWAAGTVPATKDTASDFIIQTGHTVVMEGSPKYCKNLTIQTGAVLTANVKQPTSDIRYLRIKGDTLKVDGVLGFAANPADSADVVSLQLYGPDQTLTILGSGTINICRIRPHTGVGRTNIAVVFDADVTITYIGSTGTGGAGIYSANDANNDNITFTVNAGRTLTMVNLCNLATSSSTSTDGTASTTFNINGTVNMQGGNLNLRIAAGKTCTLNVAGTLNVGKSVYPTGTTGVTSTINVTGTMNVGTAGSGTMYFDAPAQVVSGSGSFGVNAGATVNIGAPSGLDASSGPFRTTTTTLSTGAKYAYVGTAAQVAGAQLPAHVAGLTVNNAAGLTLTDDVTVDALLALTSGTLDPDTSTITVGAAGSVSRGTGYVVGPLKKMGLADPLTFHVGTAAVYSPVMLDPIAGSGDVTVSAAAEFHPSVPDTTKALKRWWDVAGSGVSRANMMFMYDSAEAFGTESDYAAARYVGGVTQWTSYSTTDFPASDSAVVSDVNPFGQWTLSEVAAVPMKFDDPTLLTVKNAGTITVDGKLNEADWTGAPTLVYGLGGYLQAQTGEYTPTAEIDVKNPFNDAGTDYYVPHKDSTTTKVKFLRKGMKLYVGLQSNDKSICKFDWEGDGLFMKIKTAAGQDREYKLYWQNIDANKDTMRYEEGVTGSGAGWGSLASGSTVNDTANVDSGYTAELMLDLEKLGYTAPLSSVQLMLVIFDPDGFQHPMNSWDHTIGSFYKSWWGSEWGGVYRSLAFTPEPFEDPASLTVKNSGAITLDGQLNEADWTGAPTLVYGVGGFLKKQVAEFTVTGGVDVKNPFNDAGTNYYVPHKDSTLTKVRFLRKGMNLYIGIQSDDKSICKFDWEGDGLFMKIKTAAGQDKEYKLYWQNIDANKDTMRYEEGVTGSGAGWGYLPTGSTVNDTTNVDNGYSAELRLDLTKLGYTAPLTSVQLMLVIFDPDGFQHPMNSWDHTIGSYYKSWWGSEWGGVYRALNFTTEAFDDPDTLRPAVSAGLVTVDGLLNEAAWSSAPTLLYGVGAVLKKQAGEYTVTGGVDVKNPFNDAGTDYYVPHKDSTLTKVKFVQRGMDLYIGFQSDDKSICKFDWEGDGLFMKIKSAAGQDREYKLYWQNIDANKDTMRYEEGVVGSGAGWGHLGTGSTVNDTTNVDNGYSAELKLKLDVLGYAQGATSVKLMLVIFDPDGFQHPMNSWDHIIGSYYKSWWGSEWGSAFKTLELSPLTDVGEDQSGIPTVFSLGQNYPNPFNPSTTIEFGLPVRSTVSIKVYDIMGREVVSLVNGEMGTGSHKIAFDARNLSSGAYFYRISATPLGGSEHNAFVSTKKLVILK